MYCKKCGKENNDDAKFCFYCGEAIHLNADYSADSNKENNKKAKKSKGKKSLIILSIVLVVVLILGLITAISLPKIQQTVLGDSAYYLYQEYQNISDLLYAGSVAELRHPETYSAKSELELTFSGNSYTSFYNSVIENAKISADVNYDKSKGAVTVDSKLLKNDDSVFDICFDYVNRQLAMSSSLNNSVLMLYGENKSSNNSSNNNVSDFNNVKNNDANSISSIVNIGKEILKNTVDKENVTKGKGEYNGERYSTVTFSFTDTQIDELLIKLTEAVLSNDNLISQLQNYAPLYAQISGDNSSVKDVLNKMLIEIKTYGLCRDEFDSFDFTVYYNSKGKIVARELKVFDGAETCIDVTIAGNIGKENANLDLISAVDECHNLHFEKHINNGALNATVKFGYTWNNSYQNILDCSISNVKSEICNNVKTLSGSLNVNYFDDVKINVRSDVKNNENTIYFNYDEEGYLGVTGTIRTVLSSAADVSSLNIPSTYTEYYYDYFEELFYEIETKVGKVFSDEIEQMYSDYYSSYNYDDYDDYYDDYYDEYYDYGYDL